MTTDDMTLVREFAAGNSQAAFTALVERHIGLVRSAALRQVGDPHLADEITQAVFIILARKAAALGPETILPAWLYRTTRYAAADALKQRRRRQEREQEAYMQSTLNQPDPAWEQIAPVLDDAMGQLGETDRAALVLRYFENKTAREIAAALRMEEDAAQKRVSRALEKLRALFVKRGVTLTATAIAGAVAANSVQAAPAGLAAKITAGIFTGTALTTTAIVMTTLQKTVVATVLAAAVGAGIYEAKQAADARSEMQTLQQQHAEQLQQLQKEHTDATNQLAWLSEEVARGKSNKLELLKLRGEVGGLRRQLGEIGKLREENQRLLEAQQNTTASRQLTADEQVSLRERANGIQRYNIAKQLALEIVLFSNAHGGQFPTNLSHLEGDGPAGKEALNTYAANFDIVFQGSISDLKYPGTIIALKEKQATQMSNGMWTKVYAFADGHAETHVEPSNNFDDWESKHTHPPK